MFVGNILKKLQSFYFTIQEIKIKSMTNLSLSEMTNLSLLEKVIFDVLLMKNNCNNLVFLNEVCHNFSVAQTHVNTGILTVVHADMKFMTL